MTWLILPSIPEWQMSKWQAGLMHQAIVYTWMFDGWTDYEVNSSIEDAFCLQLMKLGVGLNSWFSIGSGQSVFSPARTIQSSVRSFSNTFHCWEAHISRTKSAVDTQTHASRPTRNKTFGFYHCWMNHNHVIHDLIASINPSLKSKKLHYKETCCLFKISICCVFRKCIIVHNQLEQLLMSTAFRSWFEYL